MNLRNRFPHFALDRFFCHNSIAPSPLPVDIACAGQYHPSGKAESCPEEITEAEIRTYWRTELPNVELRRSAEFLTTTDDLGVGDWTCEPSLASFDPAKACPIETLKLDRAVAYFSQQLRRGLAEMARLFPEWYPWMADLRRLGYIAPADDGVGQWIPRAH